MLPSQLSRNQPKASFQQDKFLEIGVYLEVQTKGSVRRGADRLNVEVNWKTV